MVKKTKSPWCHDSNPSLFVINGPKWAELHREDWPGQKLGVLSQKIYIVILKFREQLMNSFILSLEVLSRWILVKDGTGNIRTPLKILIFWGLLVFEKNPPKVRMSIIPYKFIFLHFGSRVYSFFDLRRTNDSASSAAGMAAHGEKGRRHAPVRHVRSHGVQ